MVGENEVCDEANIPCNLLTVAATGNSVFLEDLLKVGMDPDISDSKGRTPLVHDPVSSLSNLNRHACLQHKVSHFCNSCHETAHSSIKGI